MKNYIFYLLITALFISCDVAVETDVKVGENKIGYEVSDNGEKTSLIAGDMSTIEVWEKYVQAHNDGDLDAIKNLNHDDIKIWGPDGAIIEGSDTHIEFLANWFKQNNPQWKTKYMIANEITENDTLKQWVTSCHDMELMVDSKSVKINQIHDALILDGKVKMFFINERLLVENK
ncbi:MAG: hypothetical protein CMD04_01050 [Flavobacteriales bacterium]|nr:hypothetical protein [Flavobacteriales bacterium]|tara:strand:+ start:1335 stop:1859 length:525 start_codon:yes stop_codon:yes gene_type:complete